MKENAIIFPVYYLVCAAIMCSLSIPLWLIVPLIILQYCIGKFAFDWFENAKLHFQKWKYQLLRITNKHEINELESVRKTIIESVLKAVIDSKK